MAQGQPQEGQTLVDFIKQEALSAGIDPALALAIADQESSFRPDAIGKVLPSGEQAIGTFQVLPSTAKTRGFDPNDQIQNIRGGVRYLRELLDKHQGDPQKVLAEYGGVVRNQTYVPEVIAKIQKYAAGTGQPPTTTGERITPPPQPRTTAGRIANVEPPPQPGIIRQLVSGAGQLASSVASSFDPRTPEGRRSLIATGSAMAATAIAPEVAIPAWIVRGALGLGGAFAGGAAAEIGEQTVAGAPPDPGAVLSAGREQLYLEAFGRSLGFATKAVGRRVAASPVSKKVAGQLEESLQAVRSRLPMTRTAVTPSQAGRMVEGVAQGPAKAVKDAIGEAVEQAAETGPAIETAPLRARLQELGTELEPVSSGAPVGVPLVRTPDGRFLTEEAAARAIQQNPGIGLDLLPEAERLPAMLGRVQYFLGDAAEIPFSQAHRIKKLLDSKVDWGREAKDVAERVTKGFRITLRQEMAGHAPYEAATTEYGQIAKLYAKGQIPKLHRAIVDDPERLVRTIDWQHPTQLQLVKELTVDTAAEAGPEGALRGAAAWNAVRASWTQEKLIGKGVDRMAKEIERIEASNSGQEFIQTMYGDAEGQMVWQNLKQIAGRLAEVKAEIEQFGRSKLGQVAPLTSTLRDIAYTALPGHPITKTGAMARLAFGVPEREFVYWAASDPRRTQWVVKQVLTGPNPGYLWSAAARGLFGAGRELIKPMISHESTQPPPQPTAAR